MSLIGLIVILIILGVVLQLIKAHVEPKIYLLVIILIILAVCFILLQATGLWTVGSLHLK